jgi:hypothetical protein
MKRLIALSLLLSACSKYTTSTYKLPKELKEISGLAIFNDSLLIAHNDSGNEPTIYFLTKKGKIVHTCTINNTTNTDWEDISIDPNGTIYIADVGNNMNNRTNLSIVKIDGKLAINQAACQAEIIQFSYKNQLDFPPKNSDLNFDCEAIAWYNDSLILLTKPRTIPWKGMAYIYSLPTQVGAYQLSPKDSLFIGPNGWKKDAPTALEIVENRALVLTYNRFMLFDIHAQKWKLKSSYVFKNISQKEAITTDQHAIYIGAEKHRLLGGPFLYILEK